MGLFDDHYSKLYFEGHYYGRVDNINGLNDGH